jgi:hypothetical protein
LILNRIVLESFELSYTSTLVIFFLCTKGSISLPMLGSCFVDDTNTDRDNIV